MKTLMSNRHRIRMGDALVYHAPQKKKADAYGLRP